jgi:putative tricarboxylic transport membrane protein
MRRSLTLSLGDPTIFITRPISGAIIAVAVILLLLPALTAYRARRAGRPATPGA